MQEGNGEGGWQTEEGGEQQGRGSEGRLEKEEEVPADRRRARVAEAVHQHQPEHPDRHVENSVGQELHRSRLGGGGGGGGGRVAGGRATGRVDLRGDQILGQEPGRDRPSQQRE